MADNYTGNTSLIVSSSYLYDTLQNFKTTHVDTKVGNVSVTGDGNAITSIEVSGNTMTATKETTFLTAHPTITMGEDTTATATPDFGESFTAISGITKDENGHVTQIETKTVTLPTAPTVSLSFETEALDLTQLV